MTSKNTSSSVSIEIPEGLADGLRNYWYPLMVSTDLPDDKPIGIRRLGEDLVVWRGSDGKPCLFTGHCPHRCAALSKARLVNGRLECWYHGLQFDETGQCRRVPVEREDDGPQTRHYKVASYPCEERHEFIWGYIGDVEKFPPPPLQMEPEVEGGEYNVSPFDLGYIWEAPWPLVMDNNTDTAHPPFLHRDTASKLIPADFLLDHFTPRNPRIEVVEGDIRPGGTRGRYVKEIVEEDIDIQISFLPISHRIDVGLGPEFEGLPMRLIVYIVPVDAERCVFFHHVCVKKDLISDPQEWEKIYTEMVATSLPQIYAQDVAVTRSQKTTALARSGERLMAQDSLSIQTRRLILEAWKAQQSA